ncbi:metallophosphoesterase [Actinomycetospora sp. NBC_00405]|uniref:metallophosphoesterase n=1 Tax=Actinomycetospora sp. NBC_00405 TaxID=2975952 RepID=UPI002E1A26FC
MSGTTIAGTALRAAAGVTAAGALGLGYAVGVERHWFALRRARLEVLDPDTAAGRTLRVLHVSDLHLRPGQRLEQRFVEGLAELEPDLVVNTGDNLSHRRAVPEVLRALGGLLDKPGVVVWGSNDYHGPKPKNPAHYLVNPQHRVLGPELPWRDLRAAFLEHGWLDATHARHTLTVNGLRLAIGGVDDPHIGRDDYDRIAGPADEPYDLRLGLTHSPEPRVLDAFAADGYDLVLAGHTHGGQLRLPGYGAIITNCGVDRSRARGASRWGSHMRLHVSAGLGTSPYAPARFSCRPEATLLELVPRSVPTSSTPATAGERGGRPPSARSRANG